MLKILIFNRKCHSCIGSFTNLLYVATNKEYLTKRQIMLRYVDCKGIAAASKE